MVKKQEKKHSQHIEEYPHQICFKELKQKLYFFLKCAELAAINEKSSQSRKWVLRFPLCVVTCLVSLSFKCLVIIYTNREHALWLVFMCFLFPNGLGIVLKNIKLNKSFLVKGINKRRKENMDWDIISTRNKSQNNYNFL